MARIRVAQAMDWTDALKAIVVAAGHELTFDQHAEVSFIDASASLQGMEDVLTVVVAPLDKVPAAIEQTKHGAYAFVRYPFVADEVTLLIERALDHRALA